MATTINVLCYKYKTLSNGEHPIMFRICKDGKKKYASVGISVKAKHWNFDKNEPKPNQFQDYINKGFQPYIIDNGIEGENDNIARYVIMMIGQN